MISSLRQRVTSRNQNIQANHQQFNKDGRQFQSVRSFDNRDMKQLTSPYLPTDRLSTQGVVANPNEFSTNEQMREFSTQGTMVYPSAVIKYEKFGEMNQQQQPEYISTNARKAINERGLSPGSPQPGSRIPSRQTSKPTLRNFINNQPIKKGIKSVLNEHDEHHGNAPCIISALSKGPICT